MYIEILPEHLKNIFSISE